MRCTDKRLPRAARWWRSVARHALIAAPLLAALLAGCASTSSVRELRGDGLGSTWRVKIADAPHLDLQAVRLGIQQQIDEVSHQISRWDHASSLSALNAANDNEWHTVPAGLQKALTFALHLASDTGGAYDPTVAPLVDVWGFGTHGRRYSPPAANEVSAARARVGWSKVELDPAMNRVRRPAGVQIDLSSMQHGFAADQVASYLRSLGVTRYLVDVGSELRAAGDAPEGHPWHVAIERPPSELTDASTAAPAMNASTAQPVAATPATNASTVQALAAASARQSVADNSAQRTDAAAPLHIIRLRNAGVATSGNYRYFFDYNGRRYSHRIDPRTGEPITHPLAAVTVIDPECMRADALATALTVLGPDEGLAYAREHHIAALFVIRTRQGFEERMTPMFQSYLE
jgi:thiamine biosynthesis lipoprotein